MEHYRVEKIESIRCRGMKGFMLKLLYGLGELSTGPVLTFQENNLIDPCRPVRVSPFYKS